MIRSIAMGHEMAKAIRTLLLEQGQSGNELAILLAGRIEGSTHIVDRLIIPLQEAIQSQYGCGLVIEGGCLNRIGPTMREEDRRILGILHSHPGNAYHSETDNAGVLMRFHGAYSLVVPHFGAREDLRDGMAAFTFDYETGWQEIHPASFFKLTNGPDFQVIIDELPVR